MYVPLHNPKIIANFARKSVRMEITMEILWLVLAWLCIVIGVIGCVVPGLPGVPVAYVGLWLAQLSERVQFSWVTLTIFGILTAGAVVLDYIVPALGTKNFGGTKYGAWGGTVGLVVGLFFGAAGIIIGPFVGAVLFELIAGKKTKEALKAGWGTFMGLLAGTLIKLMCCGWMAITLLYGMIH